VHIAFCYELAGSEEKPMDKMQIGNNFFIPMPVVLVGTQVSGKANFLTMPDNRYWALGKNVGDAWNAGKNLIQSQGGI